MLTSLRHLVALGFATASSLIFASAAAMELRGAGATFPAPLYGAWIEQFRKDHSDVSIRYEPVGSGEGLALFSSGVVDFAGSDVPMPAGISEKVERGVVQAPIAAGMIVLAYNLPGLSGPLKLPQDVYADIFLGKIQNWNDPKILAANPGLRLPAMTIAVVVRQDSSGTTYNFTSHLAAVSAAWSDRGPGVGKIVAWPHAAMLARGNEGVASRIKISDGSIGYVEYGFARRLGLAVAALENKEGRFVAPSPEAGAAAIKASSEAGLDNLANAMVNPPGVNAYPIVAYSWIVIHRVYPEEQRRALGAFVRYALGEGQVAALDLGYIPLPRMVAALGQSLVGEVDAAPTEAVPRPEADGGASPPKLESTAAPPPAESAPAPSAEAYTAVVGDTFRVIALKLYHDERRWRDIAAANPGLNPRRTLRAGQIIKLPR